MVAKSKVIETNSKCVCGNGDTEHAQKGYFENKCPVCGKEGTLQTETDNNFEVNDEFKGNDKTENDKVRDASDNSPSLKVVCKNCGAEFCGQDGYDKDGGTRAGLTHVNPNEVTDDEKEEVSSNEEQDKTYMSGWEGLCDLLRPLDAEAMIIQRGDFVIVKKIDMPQYAKLWAYEGINVVDDSVKITDYTPEIYNTFVIKWGETFENELVFTFDTHKQLFGERKSVMNAEKEVVKSEEDEDKDKDKDKDKEDGGGLDILGMILGSQEEQKKKLQEQAKNTDVGDLANADDLTGEDENKPATEKVPITTKEEAMRFGLKQVGKAKREDGHTIELKVIGNLNWQMGEWCHVKLPSFNEDCYMFISKCSFESSPDSEFINSLTLVDYPPSLGKPTGKDKSDESTDSSQNPNDPNASTDPNNPNSQNGSDSSSSGNSGTGSNTGTGGNTSSSGSN